MLSLVAALLTAAPPAWADDCGLEPPGSYVPTPVPTKPFEQAWLPQDPPLVRAERHPHGKTNSAPTGGLRDSGALAGKVIYLSAGHGFTMETSAWQTQRGANFNIVEDLVSTETVNQFLVPMLLNAGAQVVTVRESDLNTHLVVVDDGTPGYQEIGTGFADSSLAGWGAPPSPMLTGVNPFALAKNRLMDAAATATASARYTADFPADGYYNVYVSYTAFTARVTDAHYVVKHSGGDSHFRVNQRRHGGTWVQLGRFYFKKGARVALEVDNDSKDTGNVSLDAVRFGGGMGLIDRGLGVSARPRFEESARYHTQYAGAPTTVYDNSDTDHNDDISSRSRFAAWVHEPGEDAVYLAWHTNAAGIANSTVTGTEVYVYGPNPPNGTYQFTGVPGSDKLANFVHDELINDFRASSGWNLPTWKDRGVQSAYFGEVNPAHNSEMPSILMEIEFHDSPAGSSNLKEPAFRYLATRAISQGIIRYFADKDGLAPKFPPEPPTHVAARNQPSGMVKVQWRAPVVDTQGVAGAAATKYRVYQSADGLGWDDGTDVTTTSFSTALPAGVARYFRVAALNDGGESFASEVVGVRAPEPNGKTVLVVNAYDRLDSGLGGTDDLTTWNLGQVLRIFVAKMNDASYLARWGEAIDVAHVGFDTATSKAVTSGDVALAGYAVVGWMAGRGHANGTGPTAAEQSALSTWATASKPIFFSGANALRALGTGTPADQMFLSSVLRAGATTGNSQGVVNGAGLLQGMPGLALDDGSSGAYATGSTDVLTANGGAMLIGSYPSSAGAALAADKQQVTFGFPFETIISRPQRLEVMQRVLDYFDATAIFDGGSVVPDAGSGSDAGQSTDAGMAIDAGGSEPDAGQRVPDIVIEAVPGEFAGAPINGCGCSAVPAFSPLLLLALYRLFRARSAR